PCRIVLLVAVVVFVVMQPRQAIGQDTELTFESSELEALVTVDGEQYGTVSSGETITAPLGDQAELEVAREGFRTYSTTVEVTPGAPHTITAELPPESKEAQAILNEERQGSLENKATEQ